MTDTKIIVTMEDGSIFTMPDESWTKAFRIKYAGEEKEALRIFKKTVAKHWKEHTLPTKFGWDDKWGEDYPDQASLGKDIMYVYIRTALLAVAMESLAIEEGKSWQPTVIGVGENEVTEYTGHGKRKISLDEAFGNKEKAQQKSKTHGERRTIKKEREG
jgi:hypothetical protein